MTHTTKAPSSEAIYGPASRLGRIFRGAFATRSGSSGAGSGGLSRRPAACASRPHPTSAEHAHLPATVGPRRRIGLALASLCATACALALTAAPAAAVYTHPFLFSFNGSATPAGSFDPGNVYVDNSSGLVAGKVYVGDTAHKLVDRFSPSGAYDCQITGLGSGTTSPSECDSTDPGMGGFLNTFGEGAVDPTSGSVWIPDAPAHVIYEFSPAGKYLSQLTLPDSGVPLAVALDPSGNLLVADSFNRRIDKYDPTTLSWSIFASGTPGGPFGGPFGDEPRGVAVDVDPASPAYGNVYVADSSNTVVDVFDSSGVYQTQLTGTPSGPFGSPLRLATDPASGDLYVADPPNQVVDQFSPSGAFMSRLAVTGDGSNGVAISTSSGDVYISVGFPAYVIDVFGPGVILPDVTTNPATEVEPTVATLNGHVAPDPAGGGDVTSCRFAYGITTSYGTTASCAEGQSFLAASDVHADLSGLAPGTTYHFRLEAANASGTNVGQDRTFTTTGPPLVKEEHATEIQPTTATLHAVINPSGYETHYHFEYTTTDFANCGMPANPNCLQTPSALLGASGHSDEAVQAAISALAPGTTYHYRAVAESECEPIAHPGHVCVTDGPDETFETLPPVSVRGLTTQIVAPELVELKAELNPNGSATDYTFQYGEDTSYGGGSSQGALPVGNEFEEVTATFSGLKPNTEYHYRLIAENGYGKTETPDQTFTTEPSASEERAAENCPNTNLREENNSLALPDCRAYEQVSPTYKAGYATFLVGKLAPSGERVAFASSGAFGDATQSHGVIYYVAHRTAGGWLSESALGRPAGPNGQPTGPREFSAELDTSVFSVSEGTNWAQGSSSSSSEALYFRNADGSFVKASPTLRNQDGGLLVEIAEPDGNSADLSRFFFLSSAPLLPSDRRPESNNVVRDRLYEVSGAGGPEPTLSLVAEVPLDITGNGCGVDVVIGQSLNLVSTGGSTVFYDAPLNLSPGANCSSSAFNGPNKNVLFARIGEAAPVQVSAPLVSECSLPSPCATAPIDEARFYGASPNGSQAWFTTERPLIDADTDTTNDLYLAKLENGQVAELVQASHGDATDPTPGEGAGVQGVSRVSQDGSRAYFVATGVLTTDPNASGQSALQGADNLYAYDAQSGETKFVARLCSGKERSGSQADPACPASLDSFGLNDSPLWGSDLESDKTQLTPDGRYLVFTSYAQLTADDTDNAADVYRYDFQTGQLVRVSTARNGNDGNGNDDAHAAEIPAPDLAGGGNLDSQANDEHRAISDDGSTIVFSTDAALVSHDTNEALDVYEWSQGQVSLISSGLDPHGALGQVISSSGRDIVFGTPRSLVPADTDGVGDVYDAREGGGFPYTTPQPPCGSAESCHGPVPPEPTPPNISTPEFVGPGNGAQQLHCAKGKHRVKRHGQPRCVEKHHRHKKQHRRAHRRGANANRGGNK